MTSTLAKRCKIVLVGKIAVMLSAFLPLDKANAARVVIVVVPGLNDRVGGRVDGNDK